MARRSSCTTCSRQFADAGASAAATTRSPTLPSTEAQRCGATSRSTPGTARGTGAPTSTTARRSARRRAPSARSTRSPQSWAVLSGAGDRARARAGAGRRSTSAWSARRRPDPAARSAVRPSALEPRLHQGLRARRARERRPVHARRGLDRDGVRRARRRRRAWELLHLINPVNHGATPRRSPYRVEPYVVAADVYAVRRTPAAAAGPGTPARPAGCTA